MEPINTKCPECKGIMEPGLIADRGYGQVFASKWVEGDPKMNMWTGALKNDQVFTLRAYRCKDCGYVKLYARDLDT